MEMPISYSVLRPNTVGWQYIRFPLQFRSANVRLPPVFCCSLQAPSGQKDTIPPGMSHPISTMFRFRKVNQTKIPGLWTQTGSSRSRARLTTSSATTRRTRTGNCIHADRQRRGLLYARHILKNRRQRNDRRRGGDGGKDRRPARCAGQALLAVNPAMTAGQYRPFWVQ